MILVCDHGVNPSTIYAFDAKTGDIRWETKRPKSGWAHSTPVLAKVDGKMQLLTATHNGPQGIDPATGNVIWSYRDSKQIGDTTTPTCRDGQVYVDSGRGGMGVCIDAKGSGDVSRSRRAGKSPPCPRDFPPRSWSAHLYRLNNPGVVTCRQWSTGEQVYKSDRLDGVDHAVSPVATADGRLYFASAGKSYVLKAEPKFEVLAVNTLGDPGRASPAVAAGRIYLKGGKFLWCIGAK